MRSLTFDTVTHNRAADDAQHGRRCAGAATAHGIADHSPSDGAHQRASARLGCLHSDLLGRAHLTGNANLLRNRRGGNDLPQFLGQSGASSQHQDWRYKSDS